MFAWWGRVIERDLGGTAKATVSLGLLVFVGVVGFVALAALGAITSRIFHGPPVEPTPGWLNALDSVLIAAGAFAGVGVAGTAAKRKYTSADVVRAQTDAVERGVIPPPGVEDTVPGSGERRVTGASVRVVAPAFPPPGDPGSPAFARAVLTPDHDRDGAGDEPHEWADGDPREGVL